MATRSGGRELYVYYRVAVDDVAAVTTTVQSMQRALMAGHPRLRAALLRRPEATDGQVTLMETYAADGGVDGVLQQAIEAAAAGALAHRPTGTRHVEVFERCA